MNQAKLTSAGMAVISFTPTSVHACATSPTTCASPQFYLAAPRSTATTKVASLKNKIISGLLGAFSNRLSKLAIIAITLTLFTTHSFAQSGNKVLLLNGGALDIPHNAIQFQPANNGAMTIEFWMRLESASQSGRAFSKRGDSNSGITFQVLNSGLLRAEFGGVIGDETSDTKVSKNTWNHCAIVWSRSGGYVRYFIDGVLTRTVSTATTANLEQFNASLRFGGVYSGHYIKGAMDNVRFWSVARTPSEIAATMSMQFSPLQASQQSGLVGSWSFDDINPLSDSAGNNGNGTLDGSASIGFESVPAFDADGDGVIDSQDNCVNIANPSQADCDNDGIGDACEIAAGALDADLNGVPDGCEGDCNVNGQLDYLDIAAGAADCNSNLMIDSCEDGSGIYRNSGNLGNIGSGVPRSVTFDTLPAAVTSVTLEVSARANLSASNRFLIMKLNGGASIYLFQTTGTDCPSTANTYSRTFTASEFNTLTASGSLDVAFTAPGTVNVASCGSDALLQVRLAYEQTFTDCDNDGVRDFCAIASGTVKDCNRNGIPDSCDIATGFAKDCNNNEIPDSCDIATGLAPDCNSNGIPDSCDPDTDGDGIIDACDTCPNVAGPCNGCPLNVCGDCGTAADTDGDGTANCIDNDDDNDGVVDSMDAFPLDANESVDTDDDGQGDNSDQDDDGDGTDDVTDGCPFDATKSAPGQCGCGNPDTDTDGDGFADCVDNCVAVANPLQTDCDGNGIGEACETFTDCNANGIPDSCDLASGFAKDCNGNGKPDSCDLAVSGSPYPGAVQWTVASGGNGHWYKGVVLSTSSAVSWTSARQAAQAQGADLAILPTAAANNWVFTNVASNPLLWTPSFGPWLGGYQLAGASEPSGGWVWIDGTPIGDSVTWMPGQPDNATGCGAAEDFLHFYNLGEGVNRLNDIGLSGTCVFYGSDDRVKSAIFEWSTGLPTESDCNANGIPDSCDLANGGDCNNNGLLDACETFDQTTPDCNNNSVPDTCDIESGTARDCNLNGVPDSCDIAAGALDENSDGRIDACNYALGDFDLDNAVSSSDLGFLLIFFGEIDPPFGDLNGSGVCDAEDLGQLLGNYGILP